jgi:hypothetical protein
MFAPRRADDRACRAYEVSETSDFKYRGAREAGLVIAA